MAAHAPAIASTIHAAGRKKRKRKGQRIYARSFYHVIGQNLVAIVYPNLRKVREM